MAADQDIAGIIYYLVDRDVNDYQEDESELEYNAAFSWAYQNIWSQVINEKFRSWNQENHHIHDSIPVESDESSTVSSEYSSDEESKEHSVKKAEICKPDTKNMVEKSTSLSNPEKECKQLLGLLYLCLKNDSQYHSMYFNTLKTCIDIDEFNLREAAYQQIAIHLSQVERGSKEYEGLKNFVRSIGTLRDEQHNQSVSFKLIQEILLGRMLDQDYVSPDILDSLLNDKIVFNDVTKEIRDCQSYLIDGDSLIFAFAHSVNINLSSFNGNTLHLLFVIERFLRQLFYLAKQANFIIVFFDCHYGFYQGVLGILDLIRSCVIAHLKKNVNHVGEIRVYQFQNWKNEDYKKLIHDEKPFLLFYHDLSNILFQEKNLIPKPILEQLHCINQLCACYHQFHYGCKASLMNNMSWSGIELSCFRITFQTNSRKILKRFDFLTYKSVVFAKQTDTDVDQLHLMERWCKEQEQNDIRLLLYLQIIKDWKIDDQTNEFLIHLFPLLILHIALLLRLSLIDRHFSEDLIDVVFEESISDLLQNFQKRIAAAITNSPSTLSWSKIGDVFDGNLFAFTLNQLVRENIRFDSNTISIAYASLRFLEIPFTDEVFVSSTKSLISIQAIRIGQETTTNVFSGCDSQTEILKISNPLIDTVVQPILSHIDLILPKKISSIRHEDRYHWHTCKEVGDQVSRISDDNTKRLRNPNHRYRTKFNQKFYQYFTLYGNSMTSRDVKDRQVQIAIPAEPPSISNKDEANTNHNRKVKPKSKKEKIIEENKQRKLDKQLCDRNSQLDTVKDSIKAYPSDDYERKIQILQNFLQRSQLDELQLEPLLLQLNIQHDYLRALRRKSVLTDAEKSRLNFLLVDYFATLSQITFIKKDHDPFTNQMKHMKELFDTSSLINHEDWYRFQMVNINSFLPRREQSIRDSRVSDFCPDQWQVEFLDSVDRRESIIIVAPTASGKTYASYYAMQEVLKETDRICVYVAPTKALVNQVAATIYSKFGPVFGMFTRDYRMNLENCRILVTIPQCLEILILSPTYQHKCQRISYVIFDEIHCMTGELGSQAWEISMLLIPCPMIGLSATVNNGEEVCAWLQNVEDTRATIKKSSTSRRVCFIVQHQRMADLNKYFYSDCQLYPCNPIALMNPMVMKKKPFPADLSLSPRETLQLSDAIRKTVDKDRNDLPTCSDFCSPNWIIERRAADQFSQTILSKLQSLTKDSDTAVINQITQELHPMKTKKFDYPEPKPRGNQIIDFIKTLRERDLLPCIVFCDSRSKTQSMAEIVTGYYQELENELRNTTYKNEVERAQRRAEQIESFCDKANSKMRRKKSKSAQTSDNDSATRAERLQLEQQEAQSEENYYQQHLTAREEQLLNGILDECTLRNRKGFDKELAEKMINRIRNRNPWMVSLIERGVAYHHAGMGHPERVAVEALFRTRYIQVVFSTATLALGVHMPTKSVGFLGDSIHLDALDFRQMSGRAGRRGFDIQGHVIFIDIPLRKISHLIQSQIPDIHPKSSISTALILRLLNLYSNCKDKISAYNDILIFFQCPFIGQIRTLKNLVECQTRFNFLYTCDFLYRMNLINAQGEPVGLAGLVSHLHYKQPFCFLLAFFIAHGMFQHINNQRELMILLCHLFTNNIWFLNRKQIQRRRQKRRAEKFNSHLFLPPMPEIFMGKAKRYNEIVKKVYGSYIEKVNFAMREKEPWQLERLPFSEISFSNAKDYDSGSFEYSLHHHHSQQKSNPSISPFAALSGLTQMKFMNNYCSAIGSIDLAYELNLSAEFVPFIDIERRDQTNTSYLLNSYALDFYLIGSERLLINENEIPEGDLYKLLSDFLLELASIRTSLEVILKNEQETSMSEEEKNIFSSLFELISSVHQKFKGNFNRLYPQQTRY